jgi:alkylhydroperoxidase family enzyme
VQGHALTEAVLADYRTAPIEEKLRVMLAFLEKLTRTPEEIGPTDAARVREAGIGEQAFLDALYVQAMFAFITRCADAFDFEIPPQSAFDASASALVRFGYKL